MNTCPLTEQIKRIDQIESEMIRLRTVLVQRQREIAGLKVAMVPTKAQADLAAVKSEAESNIVPLHLLEKAAILRAVELKSVPVAAKLLGMGKTTLYRRLISYGFTPNTLPDAKEAAE